jgi:FtsP/CotA-like multicopper oxidase with cupredoxin domain
MKKSNLRKKKRVIVPLILLILFLIIFGVYLFISINTKNNPPPTSVNMGSMDMGNMPTNMNMGKSTSSSAITPVTSLVLHDSNAPVKNYLLTAQVVKRPGLPDAYTYNDVIPGPTIHVTQGDHVHVVLVNTLPVSTTIHWHGVSVPNASDGPAGVTQDAVKPGQTFTYDFIAQDAGTYWYHSHQDASNQIPAGLFGALIVDPKTPFPVDHDYTVFFHDQPQPFTTLSDKIKFVSRIIESRIGKATRPIEINGHIETYSVSAKPGQTVRLRLINATGSDMNGAPIRLAPIGVPFKVVALDGHDINKPQELTSQMLPIGSGQRYDIVFTMPPTGQVVIQDVDNHEMLAVGDQPSHISLPQNLTTFDLTQYGKSAPDPLLDTTHFDQNIPIVLGSKPGFRFGSVELIHTINGKAFPDIPNITVQEGQTIHLHIVNNTDEAHPMHLHGHIFTLLAKNGKRLAGSPIHTDSVLVGPKETWDIAFVANNPGLWMFHCHVLIHAAFGMDMMVVYKGISTPYTVGTLSGNFPD